MTTKALISACIVCYVSILLRTFKPIACFASIGIIDCYFEIVQFHHCSGFLKKHLTVLKIYLIHWKRDRWYIVCFVHIYMHIYMHCNHIIIPHAAVVYIEMRVHYMCPSFIMIAGRLFCSLLHRSASSLWKMVGSTACHGRHGNLTWSHWRFS